MARHNQTNSKLFNYLLAIVLSKRRGLLRSSLFVDYTLTIFSVPALTAGAK